MSRQTTRLPVIPLQHTRPPPGPAKEHMREEHQTHFFHHPESHFSRRDTVHVPFLDSYVPETWTDEWHCSPNIYGQFYHAAWRTDGPPRNPSTSTRLHFVHLIRERSSFTDGEPTVQLRWPGPSIYKDMFKRVFLSSRFQEELETALGKYDICKRTDFNQDDTPRFTEKVYTLDRMRLPDSYYETLTAAVREHQKLEPVISQMLNTAISETKQ